MGEQTQTGRACRDFARIEAAIGFLQTHFREQPDLAEIAAAVNLSPYHFQRLFSRWAGISPKQFLQCLTMEHARRALDASDDVLSAALNAGLSGPSRLHDLFVTFEAVTPGEYKARGDDLIIHYGIHDGPFGAFVLATTDRGICSLEFVGPDGCDGSLSYIRRRLPGATFIRDDDRTAAAAENLFDRKAYDRSMTPKLIIKGTNFQISVWRALLTIKPGQLTSYSAIARAIGKPGAVRAVGSAVGANPVCYLIPCHRVIRSTSLFDTNYRWGSARKLAMIGLEAATLALEDETSGYAA